MDDLGMWRKYEIGTMELGTLRAVIAVIKDFVDHWGRFPTAEEIQREMQGR